MKPKPFSDPSDGAIYFRDGKVAYAESSRTPGAASRAYAASAADPPLHRITAILAITEPTVDAALELLPSQSRYARSRSSRVPDAGPASDISTEALLAEVARRQRILGPSSAVLTAVGDRPSATPARRLARPQAGGPVVRPGGVRRER
jgi:hypothetical protein